MSEMSEPIVLWAGSEESQAPLVVLLHGRGHDESSMIGLADLLPADFAYAAPRGPIALPDGGFTWFENAGLGRPRPESLAGSVTRVRGWIDLVAPAPRPLVLVGFSAGALFGGALAFSDVSRYAGFALLHGALPLSSGFHIEDEPWTGLPMLAVHAEHDEVMPPELMAESWRWVHEESGATVTSVRTVDGHAVTSDTGAAIAAWLAGLFGT